MKPICIIPARGGSKGIPKKNIRPIKGKPLIAYAIETAVNSNLFSHVIVSTEDPEITNISKQYGAEIPFTRPSYLATDTASNDEVLLHAVSELYSIGFDFDVTVMRDCTVPFIDENDMKGALDLLNKSNCDAVFASVRAHPNPYFGMMELNSKGFLEVSKVADKNYYRRQDAPIVYDIVGLFIHNVRKLLQTKNMIVSRILPYEISKEHGHMIDFEIDFKIAEFLLEQKLVR